MNVSAPPRRADDDVLDAVIIDHHAVDRDVQVRGRASLTQFEHVAGGIAKDAEDIRGIFAAVVGIESVARLPHEDYRSQGRRS